MPMNNFIFKKKIVTSGFVQIEADCHLFYKENSVEHSKHLWRGGHFTQNIILQILFFNYQPYASIVQSAHQLKLYLIHYLQRFNF